MNSKTKGIFQILLILLVTAAMGVVKRIQVLGQAKEEVPKISV